MSNSMSGIVDESAACENGYKDGFRDGLSHAAEIIWPTGNTTNIETMTLIKASGIIRKEMLSEALAGFKPDAKRFRTAFEMAESASRINLIQEVIELIDGLEGSWADLEYNDVLQDVIKAIIKKYGKEV